LCFVSVFVFASEIDDLGSRRCDTVQALAQLQHPVASSEALDVRYQGMHHALYRRIHMAIEFASSLPLFLS
jgi:hypothetical protein